MESETYIAADPALIAERLRARVGEWSPGLVLRPYEDRGAEGVRAVVSGELVGSCEWWVQAVGRGAVVHWWLRAQPTVAGTDTEPRIPRGPFAALWRRRERLLLAAYGRRWRRLLFSLKDELEVRSRDADSVLSRRPSRKAGTVADQTQSSIDIAATPSEIMAVISDFDSYPQWVDSMKSAEVLTSEGGKAKTVRMVLDHALVKDDYVLEYSWATDAVSWKLVKGTLLKTMDGSYLLTPKGGTTTVTYTLKVDVNMPMIGMFRRKAEKTIIDGALKGLKKRVEG
ncbi:hypothetical protein GCM10009841_16020 [Microlunatus panaciterrae]|uniref:Ribosome-associated toxin RatA of RatAB toxin-antitoxin module n=1 Tax=Microlunatus panaciterrae TaxID=400768 RepID=A0ABS2RMD9_9ACTN|nr:SRPBCC family protein [Microlunatus panaciterrae]MBM7800160.1 ribosome-associated toxin RatA of RatAB toxin-antitoxin module [Microlunatus panaciterrae]